jgi:protein phosphatase 2C family protein 2/3
MQTVYATCSGTGGRLEQEDRFVNRQLHGTSFFAVFDGHGGAACAEYLARHMADRFDVGRIDDDGHIRSVCLGLDSELSHMQTTGSTAVFCFVQSTGPDAIRVTVGNVGDSRCVVYAWEGTHVKSYSTADHTPRSTQEKKRIEACGSYVHNGRVRSMLATSRAFGDFFFKDKRVEPSRQEVSVLPDIYRHTVRVGSWIVLASDGLWNVMCERDVYGMIQENSARSLDEIARRLKNRAMELGSRDNITVTVIKAATAEFVY